MPFKYVLDWNSISLAIVALLFIPGSGMTQDTRSVERLKDLVQMPVAVNKAIENGADTAKMKRLAGELAKTDVEPSDFNQTMRNGPAISESMSEDEIGAFVKKKKESGLRGKELANAIHEELNARGIPAGGKKVDPARDDFIPPGQRKSKKMKRSGKKGPPEDARGKGKQARDKQGSGPDNPRDKGKANHKKSSKSNKSGKSSDEQSHERPGGKKGVNNSQDNTSEPPADRGRNSKSKKRGKGKQ